MAEAHERRLPVLVHAGRGIPALGAHILELAKEFPQARFILAHAGVCDLAWIWRRVDEFPNVFFDTAWWTMPDLLALFAYVPPGRILYATDIPFSTPMHSSVLMFRCALQAGLSREQIACVAGAQLERLLAGDDAIDAGPAPGPGSLRIDPLLHRVSYFLTSAVAVVDRGRLVGGAGRPRPARLPRRRRRSAGGDLPLDPRAAAVAAEPRGGGDVARAIPRLHLLVLANVLAGTPDVPVD